MYDPCEQEASHLYDAQHIFHADQPHTSAGLLQHHKNLFNIPQNNQDINSDGFFEQQFFSSPSELEQFNLTSPTINTLENYESWLYSSPSQSKSDCVKTTSTNMDIESDQDLQSQKEQQEILQAQQEQEIHTKSSQATFPENRIPPRQYFIIRERKSRPSQQIKRQQRLLYSTNQPSEDYRYCKEEIPNLLDPLTGMYFITGDVCILRFVMEKDNFSRFSQLNVYKQPMLTKSDQATGTLEVTLNNRRKGLRDFNFLIEKMRSCSSQGYYDASKALEQYQKFVNNMQQKKHLLANESSVRVYEAYFAKSYEKFEKSVPEKLLQISGTHSFFVYTISRMNLLNFEMEMSKFGYSEALLALLGLDFTMASNYLWRKGLFDFVDKASYETLLFEIIYYKLGYQTSQKTSTIIRTFDNIDVYATGQNHIHLTHDASNPFMPFNEILYITTFEINPTMIKSLMEIRRLTKEKSQEYIRDIEDDLQYSMESQMFMERYYSSAIEVTKKRAKYREIKRENVQDLKEKQTQTSDTQSAVEEQKLTQIEQKSTTGNQSNSGDDSDHVENDSSALDQE